MRPLLVSQRRLRAPYLPLLLALAVASVACGKAAIVEAPTPGSLVLVQGNNQQVQGGSELPNPIVIRVLSTDGSPIGKLPIET